MGKVPSASTISSSAFLTETGRKYLFGKDNNGNPIRFDSDGVDNFEITQFALFDNDRNYRTTTNFSTGEMPDVAGTSDDSCLKTASNLSINNIIIFEGTISQSFEENFQYVANEVTVDAYNYQAN